MTFRLFNASLCYGVSGYDELCSMSGVPFQENLIREIFTSRAMPINHQ